MRKISVAQQIALDKLTALGKPSTSQEICVQITTMQSLQKAGHVKPVEQFGDNEVYGRECETIHWQRIVKWQGTHNKRASHAFLSDAIAGQASLCGREPLSSNGVTSDKPQITACGNCAKKAKKLGLME